MTDRVALIDRFIADSGWAGSTRSVVAGDASQRSYDRLRNNRGDTAILMDAPPDRGETVRPFIDIGHYLIQCGLSAPTIYHADTENGFLLIEDLGDGIFARLIDKNPTTEAKLYRAATDVLAHLHQQSPMQLPNCDAAWLTQMTEPAFEWYAGDYTAETMDQFTTIFRPLAALLDGVQSVVILRDYHAENLLWMPRRAGPARVGLLDFQDALLGHPAYDLVSILQDARRDVTPEVEAEMIGRYLRSAHLNHDDFRMAYALLGAQRNLRILGVFARLCLRDDKAHYIELIPRVWSYVMRNLTHPALAPLAAFIKDTLPLPTPEYLEKLKTRCGTIPQPS